MTFRILSFLALLSIGKFAFAAITPGTANTTPGFDTNPELDGQTLVSITTGGTTYNVLGATAANTSGGSLFRATNETAPANANEALSGLRFTQGLTNVGTTSYTLPTTLADVNDTTRMFFGEINILDQAGDAVQIRPTSGGSAINGWVINITSGDYGAQTALWDPLPSNLPLIGGRITTFLLSDFVDTGGADPLVNVDGFQLVDNVGGVDFDPNIAGIITTPVPEPSTFLLLATAAGCLPFVRRKLKKQTVESN